MNELFVGVSSPSLSSLSPRFEPRLHSWTTSTIRPPRPTTLVQHPNSLMMMMMWWW